MQSLRLFGARASRSIVSEDAVFHFLGKSAQSRCLAGSGLFKWSRREKATAVPADTALKDTTSAQWHPKFEDSKEAYARHSTKEILRAYFVFSLCSIDVLARNQFTLLKWSRRLLGATLFRKLMLPTLYGQFAGGETDPEILSLAKRYSTCGLQPMFAYTAMEVHGGAKGEVTRDVLDRAWKRNFDEITHSIELAAKSSEFANTRPKASTKLTFIGDAELLKKLSTIMERNVRVVSELSSKPEAASDLSAFLKHCTQQLRTTASGYSYQLLPANIISNTYLPSILTNVPFHLAFHEELEKSGLPKTPSMEETIPTWTDRHAKDLDNLWEWMIRLSQHALKNKICFLWDAEQSYLQTAIENLVLDTMRRFNTQLPVLGNTYQCYLKRTRDIVMRDLEISEVEGFCFSGKFVRGAYIDEERRLSKETGQADPVQPTYEDTTNNYHSVSDLMLREANRRGKRVQMTFATHNLDTVRYLLKGMKEMGVTPDGDLICFAQLIGMRDYISFPLGRVGIPASKLIHYGPLEETLGHLSRRALENTSVMPTASTERFMLHRELKRRLLNK